MKNNKAVLLICTAGLACSFLFAYFAGENDHSHWKLASGTVIGLSYGRSGTRTVEYTDEQGSVVEAEASYGLPGRCIGDRFQLLYNPDNKRQVDILEDHPLFLRDEPVDTIFGKVINEPEFRSNDSDKIGTLDFQYFIHGHSYNRTQLVHLQKSQNLSVKKDMYFRVLCWSKNPQRSILDCDHGALTIEPLPAMPPIEQHE